MTDRHINSRPYQVRAALDGRLSQTRLVLTPLKSDGPGYVTWPIYARKNNSLRRIGSSTNPDRSAPYAVGDKLWVRETWRALHRDDCLAPRNIAPDRSKVTYEADPENRNKLWAFGKTRTAIHMPRWASRLTLLVTEVRVQRLQEISAEDAIAEGIEPLHHGWFPYGIETFMTTFVNGLEVPAQCCAHPRDSYRLLWDSLHGKGAWDVNPWVCALTFTVHHCNIDDMEARHEP